ncbi:hypothetical protein HEO27_011950 [Escherichia coli]|nr:hypothetical protein [Escherichia coli]
MRLSKFYFSRPAVLNIAGFILLTPATVVGVATAVGVATLAVVAANDSGDGGSHNTSTTTSTTR